MKHLHSTMMSSLIIPRLFSAGNHASILKLPHRFKFSKVNASLEDDGKILQIPEPQLDIDSYCDPSKREYFIQNIRSRKGVGNMQRIIELKNELKVKTNEVLRREIIKEALKIPNDTHPEPYSYGNKAKVIQTIGSLPEFSYNPKPFDKLMEETNQFRMKELTALAGHKAYYLIRELADLEHALIRYVVQRLVKSGFSLISVPDILHHQIIECCGVPTSGQRSLVYRLDGDKHLASAAEGELCLSGTAEMALGGFLMNQTFNEDNFPKRYVAVSRCYRAETAPIASERGLYRVHQFTKVEMFGASTAYQSGDLLEEFRSIQEEIFGSFNLYLQVLDMPAHELGAPAYRKYDIEAWLPSRHEFGEVSSCSNCTDYQSRRLNIQYSNNNNPLQMEFAHTVNGTACAIPRLIMAICETHQQEDGSIRIPPVLRPFMSQNIIKPARNVTKFTKRYRALTELIDVEN